MCSDLCDIALKASSDRMHVHWRWWSCRWRRGIWILENFNSHSKELYFIWFLNFSTFRVSIYEWGAAADFYSHRIEIHTDDVVDDGAERGEEIVSRHRQPSSSHRRKNEKRKWFFRSTSRSEFFSCSAVEYFLYIFSHFLFYNSPIVQSVAGFGCGKT